MGGISVEVEDQTVGTLDVFLPKEGVLSMSRIQFQCPKCKAVLVSDEVTDGMTVLCPECSTEFEVHPMEDSGKSNAEKPTFDKWLLDTAQRLLYNIRFFFKFERLVETDVSHFQNAASTFEFSRLFPLAVICLGFGWCLRWLYLGQDLDFRYSCSSRWAILPIAALALYGAFRANRHFLRPKVSQWGAWIATCLFTAVAGILLLCALQAIAEWTLEAVAEGARPRNILLFAVVLIGYCYRLAFDPNTTLFAKFIGFVGGVGFGEEAIKLLPICLLVLYRRKLPFKLNLSLRSFLMLGFFSGLGFGIGEALGPYAIPGCRDYEEQLTRWFACVPSHAIYTIIDAAFLWMFHRRIAQAAKLKGKVGWFALCVAVVALLHGIYDTLCGLSFMGPILDAASLVLMWKVVRYAANHYASVEDGEYSGLEDFNATTLRTFGKSFAKTYLVILIGVVIYAKIACI